jgi:PAS domain S-box-containing protein
MNELQRAREFYRALVRTSMDGFCMVDNQGRLLNVNEVYCQMIGYSREELLAMTVSDVEAMETPEDTARHIQQIKTQGPDRFETRHRHKDGRLLDIEVSAHFVPGGRDSRFLVFLRDITERKQLETQRLAHSLMQRDALVREVHHHIKNNLQGVASLLQQQVEESPEAGAALKKAIARVKAVAVVHGLQGEAYSQVALCDVVRAISLDLQELTPLPLRLETVPHFKPVLLADAETVPIALIVNELLFNAVKHGAAAQADQAIHIILEGSENEMHLVIYSVHGRLPQDFDFAAGRGLGTGLTLVKSLLPPEGASLSIANADGGVRAELRLTTPVLINPNAVRGEATFQ